MAVSKAELANYYSVRLLTKRLGFTDDKYDRPVIPRGISRDQISRDFYEKCYVAELGVLEIGHKLLELDGDARERKAAEDISAVRMARDSWKGEALRSREEINGLREQLGLPRQDIP